MNPWIEQDGLWPDFHVAFVPALRRQLAGQVLPKYIVLLEEQIYIHEIPPVSPRTIRPDLAVTRPGRGPAPAVGVAEIEAPARGLLPAEDVERLPFLEVRDRHGRELVTVVELLSPSNKQRGGIGGNISRNAAGCSRAGRISSKSTCSAADRRCRWRTGPNANTPRS